MRVWIIAACLLMTAFVVPTASAQDLIGDDCIGKPGAVQGCASTDNGECASVSFGLQGAGACHRPGGVVVCTSMQGPYSCLHFETII